MRPAWASTWRWESSRELVIASEANRRLLAIVRDDEVCRRLMTVPGVGPVVALTYRATVDVPARFPALQVGRSGFWTDTVQVSVGRDQPNRRDIKVRRRDDADDALRSGPKHADPHQQVVLAQGLGHEDRQAARDEKGDRGAGASVGRDHASHMGWRHRVPLHPGIRSGMTTVQDQMR
jgi:hypothetical protein